MKRSRSSSLVPKSRWDLWMLGYLQQPHQGFQMFPNPVCQHDEVVIERICHHSVSTSAFRTNHPAIARFITERMIHFTMLDSRCKRDSWLVCDPTGLNDPLWDALARG